MKVEHMPQCECTVCAYGREVNRHLIGLTPEQMAFFEDMYSRLCHTELDLDVAECIIDGTWADANHIIAYRRRKIEDKKNPQSPS